MTPYYEDDACRIYHGDCRALLLEMDPFDLILTDPPYGISIVGKNGTVGGTKAGRAAVYNSVVGDDEPFDPGFLVPFGRHLIFWGGNHYADRLPASSCWLIWDKKEGGSSDNFADCELAWTNLERPARLFSHLWRGMIRKKGLDEVVRYHPTQKPISLMRWCLTLLPDAQTICDPFMGSGTTLRAAKDLGRKAIGIEIEERYCEIAANRLSQEVLAL